MTDFFVIFKTFTLNPLMISVFIYIFLYILYYIFHFHLILCCVNIFTFSLFDVLMFFFFKKEKEINVSTNARYDWVTKSLALQYCNIIVGLTISTFTTP